MDRTPLPMPLRILFKGASTVLWTSFMSGPRTDLAYPRVVEKNLLERGLPVRPEVRAVPAERTRMMLSTWETEVSQLSPDVIVLHCGHMETVHAFIPRWLERHARGTADRPGFLRERYRRRLLGPAWSLLVRLQAQVDRKVPTRYFDRRTRKVGATLERYVRRSRTVASPLVLVVGLVPQGSRWDDWFPGMPARLEQMDAELRAFVQRVDHPDVRYVDLMPLYAEHAARGEEACLDGGHFTPQFHADVGDLLTAEVLAWAETQTHLGW